MNWVLGIDPSASKQTDANAIGWCLFRDKELQETGELTPDPLTGFTRVRNWLRNKFKHIYSEDESPSITVGVETAYLGPNPNVFLGLIRVKAHIESVTLDSGHLYREVSPLISFQAATGLVKYRGKNTRKDDIRASVLPRYHLPEDTSEHVCDSLAIAEAIINRQYNGER